MMTGDGDSDVVSMHTFLVGETSVVDDVAGGGVRVRAVGTHDSGDIGVSVVSVDAAADEQAKLITHAD